MDDDIPYATAVAVPAPLAKRKSQFFLRRTKSKVLSDQEIKQLEEQGFPEGLARTLSANNEVFPLRIWIVDNSGSMNAPDGCRLIRTKSRDQVKMSKCTRWKEIQEVVLYHAQMAGLLESSTVFRVSLFIFINLYLILV